MLQIRKALLIAALSVVLLFIGMAFLRFGFIYWIYSTVEDWVTVRLGFDYYIAQLVATTFSAIFSFLLPALAWYIFLGKKQAWGIGILIGFQVLICTSIYIIGNGVCFDRRSGKPLCYYADTPKGRVWSKTPGFDPESGKPFKLYTREMKELEDRQPFQPKPITQSATNRRGSVKPSKKSK